MTFSLYKHQQKLAGCHPSVCSQVSLAYAHIDGSVSGMALQVFSLPDRPSSSGNSHELQQELAIMSTVKDDAGLALS